MRVSRITVLSISLLVQLAAVLIFLQGFFPVKQALPGYADWKLLPPEPTKAIIDDIMADSLAPEYLAKKNVTVDKIRNVPKEYDRLVLMVVDAMRTDFIVDRKEFNYTKTLLKEGHAMIFNAKAAPPTVTMPRIKALTTGSIPAFVDVVLNFDSSVLKEDNLISQLHRHNKDMVFYGDDTWLKMFPKHFKRSDGVTSFFVTDFTQVDTNVTRHLEREMASPDWEVMVLHFLGVDHVGHLSGDDTLFMGPKLRQMDHVVRYIHNAIMEHTDRRTLFVLCSDHGMNERGNHGGASDHEISTPLVFMKSDHKLWPEYRPNVDNTGGEKAYDINHGVEQMDIAPTLATLLGVPIPKNNLGMILSPTLRYMNLREQLHAVQLNVHQIYVLLKHNVPLYDRESGVATYKRGLKLHADWLTTQPVRTPSQKQTNQFLKAMNMYYESALLMREKLSSSMFMYDLHGMSTAIIILLLCSLVLANCVFYSDFPFSLGPDYSVISIGLMILLILVQITVCSSSVKSATLCGQCPSWLAISSVLLPLVALSVNFIRVSIIRDAMDTLRSLTLLDRLLLGGLVLHILSLSSTSFIEEEHQTWYFFSTTLLVLLAAKICTNTVQRKTKTREILAKSFDFAEPEMKYGILFRDHEVKQRKQHEEAPLQPHKPFAPTKDLLQDFERDGLALPLCACALLLVFCRLLRVWNQTGVKWAYMSDIQDFLDRPAHKPQLSFAVIVALVAVAIMIWIQVKVTFLRLTLTFSLGLIYGVKAGMGNVAALVDGMHSQQGTTEAQLVTVILILSFLISVLWPPLCQHLSRQDTLVTDWDRAVLVLQQGRFVALVYFLLLTRTHNIPVLAILAGIEFFLSKFVLQGAGVSDRGAIMIYLVMGHVSFFVLGNSNSLNTIDLTSGFVGIQDFKPAIIAVLIAISTYCGPLYWFVSLCYHFCRSARYTASDKWRKTFGDRLLDVCCVYALHRCICLTVYYVLASLMRYHLFVWSVFSPKLLYESMQTLVTTVAIYLGVLLNLLGSDSSNGRS